MNQHLTQVADIVTRVGKVDGLDPDPDIFEAGVASLASLELLVELEGTFDVSIPDDDFVQARTIRALAAMVERLRSEAA